MTIRSIFQAARRSVKNGNRKRTFRPGRFQENRIGIGRRLCVHTLAGALFGIAILHPLSMIAHDFYSLTPGTIFAALARAFTFEHVPMAIFFILVGSFFGMIHGTYIHIITRLNEEVRLLAVTDELTGLHNRHFFMDRIELELERARRYQRNLSFLMIDLDDFKHYNDTHGHQPGDRLLQDLARCFQGLTRKTDVAARYGGEEFVILMPETAKAEAAALAERICTAVAQYPFAHRETQPGGKVTISVGVSEFPSDADSVYRLIQKADQSLYQAKDRGKNRVCVPDENRAEAVKS